MYVLLHSYSKTNGMSYVIFFYTGYNDRIMQDEYALAARQVDNVNLNYEFWRHIATKELNVN